MAEQHWMHQKYDFSNKTSKCFKGKGVVHILKYTHLTVWCAKSSSHSLCQRRYCVLPTIHCFQWDILYKYSSGSLLMKCILTAKLGWVLNYLCFITNKLQHMCCNLAQSVRSQDHCLWDSQKREWISTAFYCSKKPSIAHILGTTRPIQVGFQQNVPLQMSTSIK